MLQSNDNDRWPMWDREIEIDDDDQSPEKKPETKGPAQKPTQGVTDKSITKTKEKLPQNLTSAREDFMRFASLGTELFAAVMVGTLLGWAVSRYIGGGAIAIAIGVVIGAAAGFLNIYRIIVEEEQKEEQAKRGSSK